MQATYEQRHKPPGAPMNMGWMEVVMKKDNWKSDYDETVALDARNIMTRNTEIQGKRGGEKRVKRGGTEKRERGEKRKAAAGCPVAAS